MVGRKPKRARYQSNTNNGKRKTKQAYLSSSDDSSSSSDDDEDEETKDEQKKEETVNLPSNQVHKAARRKARNRINNRLEGSEIVPLFTGNQKELIERLPFCCANCKCRKQHYRRVQSLEQVYSGQQHKLCYFICPDADEQANPLLDHLKCCHGIKPKNEEGENLEDFESRYVHWAPPVTAAITEAIDKMEDEEEESSENGLKPEFHQTIEWIEKQQIEDAYITAKGQESKFYNDDGLPQEGQRLLTSEDYKMGVLNTFQNKVKSIAEGQQKKKPAVVLDAFAGVGTGILVLKRLGIDIKKVIHIEHDKVATHVYRMNHDTSYSGEASDGIDHVYDYSEWEDLVGSDNDYEEMYEKVEEFVTKHGPIDIVIGGPPCIDYSKVNAYRKGTEGHQGNYLINFGRVIRIMEQIQIRSSHPLYFLAENVFLTNQERKESTDKGEGGGEKVGDKDEVTEAFGLTWDPVNLDSQYFSPARRNRHFWTNIPLCNIEFDTQASHASPESCLETGYFLPSQIVFKQTHAKCNCLMASRTRIDEPNSLRMYVFQNKRDKQNKLYYGRPLTVVERERLMGYPEGYVEKPVRDLFQKLRDDALVLQGEKDDSWRERLDVKFHTFAGNYHNLDVTDYHRFDIISDFPFVSLKLAPPVKGTTNVNFFNAMDYSKHLLGNAFSVPVVEILLKPLQDIFSTRQYEKYSYNYAWEQDKKVSHSTQ